MCIPASVSLAPTAGAERDRLRSRASLGDEHGRAVPSWSAPPQKSRSSLGPRPGPDQWRGRYRGRGGGDRGAPSGLAMTIPIPSGTQVWLATGRPAQALRRSGRSQELDLRRLRRKRPRCRHLLAYPNGQVHRRRSASLTSADVPARLSDHAASRIADLLPWRWKAAQTSAVARASCQFPSEVATQSVVFTGSLRQSSLILCSSCPRPPSRLGNEQEKVRWTPANISGKHMDVIRPPLCLQRQPHSR